MRKFVWCFTICVLVLGVLTWLTLPGFFVIGAVFGNANDLVYFLLTFVVLLTFVLSVFVSLAVATIAWRNLRFRAACPLLAACLLLVVWFCSLGHPSDAVFESHFHWHEAEFDRLAAMANKDSNMVRIAYDFTYMRNNVRAPRPDSKRGITKQRWNQYRRLFRTLGLSNGLSNYQNSGMVEIPASTFGLVTGGDEKGYAYLEGEPPSPVVKTLDNIPPKVFARAETGTSYEHGIVYKKLDGKWYMYYAWDR